MLDASDPGLKPRAVWRCRSAAFIGRMDGGRGRIDTGLMGLGHGFNRRRRGRGDGSAWRYWHHADHSPRFSGFSADGFFSRFLIRSRNDWALLATL